MEGYPLEGPVIYLPSFQDTRDVDSDGKLLSLPNNWASSPILTELIEELFEYIAIVLDSSSNLPSSYSGVITPEPKCSPVVKIQKSDDSTLLHSVELEQQQFSSCKIDTSTSFSKDLVNRPKETRACKGPYPNHPSTNTNLGSVGANSFLKSICAPAQSEIVSEQPIAQVAPEVNLKVRDDEKITSFLHNQLYVEQEVLPNDTTDNILDDIAYLYRLHLDDEILCLNSDFIALQATSSKTIDDIADIEQKIRKCKHRTNSIDKEIIKCSTGKTMTSLKTMTSMPIDDQVRSSGNADSKARVRAINDTLSVLTLALNKKIVPLKEFLETSGQLGREKFLFKYVVRERRKQSDVR